jgi:hypothetical protein
MTAVDFVGRAVAALEKLQVPYIVVGSFSSNLYGIPRSTNDADFVVELGTIPVTALAAEMGPDFQLDPQMSFETITATMRHRLTHQGTGFVIELFLLSDDPHDRERFSRRIKGDVGGRQAFVPTAEDVVITKLRWSLGGGRLKDVEDARGVLAVQQGRLDLDYVRQWCDRHGTRELFENVLGDASGVG